MGAPMARNLLAAGARLAVTDPQQQASTELVGLGATEASVISDQVSSDIIFSTLPNDSVLREVILGRVGEPGLAEVMRPGTVLVEMSTVSPEVSETVSATLRKVGILYLRAPLSGSTAMAQNASLTILASGEKAAWDIAIPFLERMSSRQFYLGEAEEARYMKLVLNTLVGATSAILAEAVALGASGGLSRASMMEVICESAVASPLLKYKAGAVVDADYAPAFTIEQMIKDFTLISAAGGKTGVPMLTTNLILELYRAAANSGLRKDDFFALVKWQADISA